MSYTGREIFNIAMAVMDEISETGALNPDDVAEYEAKAPMLLDLWSKRMAKVAGKRKSFEISCKRKNLMWYTLSRRRIYMKVKQNIISFLLGALLMLPFGGYATSQLIAQAVDVPILVDGQRIDTTVYAIEDRNYTSVRDIAEAMGGIVEWKDGQVQIETPKTDIEKVVADCKDSCVMIYSYVDDIILQGSGFCYNGYIVTAKHVIEGAAKIDIFVDDSIYARTGTIHYIDDTLDIAILTTNANLPSVTLGDSDTLREGQKLIAITSPAGVQNAVDECFYNGLSYTNGDYYIGITDSNMSGGSSGGAIFDTDGRVIGVDIAGIEGNNDAIPINKVKAILEKLS